MTLKAKLGQFSPQRTLGLSKALHPGKNKTSLWGVPINKWMLINLFTLLYNLLDIEKISSFKDKQKNVIYYYIWLFWSYTDRILEETVANIIGWDRTKTKVSPESPTTLFRWFHAGFMFRNSVNPKMVDWKYTYLLRILPWYAFSQTHKFFNNLRLQLQETKQRE